MIIVLLTNILLTRMLLPNEFGKIGVIMFFVSISTVLTEGGMAGALIRKKSIKIEDYSTVFTFNLVVSLSCFILLNVFAKYISIYYSDPEIEILIRCLSFVLISDAFQIVHNAKLIHEMNFKKRMILRLISVIFGSIVALLLGFLSFGVWALVFLQITNSFSLSILYWLNQRINIRVKIYRDAFKDLFGFGINTTIASLLNTVFENIYQLVIGRFFSLSSVGYYYQAKRLQDVPGGILNLVMQTVFFSGMSKYKDSVEMFRKNYLRAMKFYLMFLGLISSCVFLFSDVIISILYGKQWLESVFYMKLISIAAFFYLLEKINRVVFKVFNKTRKILFFEIVKKVIQSIGIIWGIYNRDLSILLIAFIVTSIIGYVINSIGSSKILLISVLVEFKLVIKISIFVFFIGYVTSYIMESYSISLVQRVIFAILYCISFVVFSIILNIVELKEVKYLLFRGNNEGR